MANLAILIGSTLVAFVCSILVVSSALFVAGVSLSWFQIPIATAAAAGFGWWLAGQYFSRDRARVFGLAIAVCVMAVALFALLDSALYDVSWDGQTYHAEAIARLASGWNPFRDASPADVDYPNELAFFPKGPWIAAGALYGLTGSFEAGKAFHLTLILASWLFWLAALRTLGLRRSWVLILSLVAAFSPVSSDQMLTYYVDGHLSSLLGITIALLILLDRRADRALMVALALVVALTLNTKLTSALYVPIIVVGYWVWYAFARKTRRAELGAWLLAGGIVGVVFLGYNPYVSQYMYRLFATGNPFPNGDWRSLVSVESHRIFPGLGRVAQLAASLFSRSEVSPSPSFTLKLPFTVSLDEIKQFDYPDVRVGGFGPLFGGALLLAVITLALRLWAMRRRPLEQPCLLVLIGLVAVSALSFSEAWWARFAPQVWMIPVMVALVGLRTVPDGLVPRAAVALSLILCLDVVMIGGPYVVFSVRQSLAVAHELSALRGRGEPIPLKVNDFPGVRHRFEREGIPYIEVETLPCTDDRRRKVVASEAEICVRGG